METTLASSARIDPFASGSAAIGRLGVSPAAASGDSPWTDGQMETLLITLLVPCPWISVRLQAIILLF